MKKREVEKLSDEEVVFFNSLYTTEALKSDEWTSAAIKHLHKRVDDISIKILREKKKEVV